VPNAFDDSENKPRSTPGAPSRRSRGPRRRRRQRHHGCDVAASADRLQQLGKVITGVRSSRARATVSSPPREPLVWTTLRDHAVATSGREDNNRRGPAGVRYSQRRPIVCFAAFEQPRRSAVFGPTEFGNTTRIHVAGSPRGMTRPLRPRGASGHENAVPERLRRRREDEDAVVL
jgi:hypothetical protein